MICITKSDGHVPLMNSEMNNNVMRKHQIQLELKKRFYYILLKVLKILFYSKS